MKRGREIYPDEILMDSSNVSGLDKEKMEGRLEKPISKTVLYSAAIIFMTVMAVFLFRAFDLEALHGSQYRTESANNLLRPVPIFASRGAIFDRNGLPLSWNAPAAGMASSSIPSGAAPLTTVLDMGGSVPQREYATTTGLSHVLGYVQYPSKDSNGFYYRNDFEGVDGVEKYMNNDLTGENGSRLVEMDAKGGVVSESVVKPPVPGKTETLSIDSRLQSDLFENIKLVADSHGFTGGSGVIMDVRTGEIIALTSYPEYDSQVMSDKIDTIAVNAELNDPGQPFLDRAVDGLYAPGSIVKPYLAMGGLNDGVITPQTTIDDAGYISIPNPYDPAHPSIFKGWRVGGLGLLDVEKAIAMSSDIFFYEVGGGYQSQKGLGIAGVDKYLEMFGLGEAIPGSFLSGPSGQVSSPTWKEQIFGEPWYLGDTYHTAIGQYGTQVTPSQMVRAVASIANGGDLLVPTISKGDGPNIERTINLPQADFGIVRDGMRQGVATGISTALNVPYVAMAAKTGTAQIGVGNSRDNSWVTGFWPYQDPKYAFAIVMENGPAANLVGAIAVMRYTIDWMNANTPEYFK